MSRLTTIVGAAVVAVVAWTPTAMAQPAPAATVVTTTPATAAGSPATVGAAPTASTPATILAPPAITALSVQRDGVEKKDPRDFAMDDVLSVAVGLEDASLVVTTPVLLTTYPLRGPKSVALLLAGGLLLALTVYLARKTSMLRDSARPADGPLFTYSLGRTQMAFWFVNVVLAVLLIWAVTGSAPPITSSVLALLGIGAGTALGAAVVDQNTNASPAKPSDNFFRDILSDGGGSIVFHRFQMLIWTLVLFFIFWGAVWNRLALPDFDTTLLALMGISAGTYLGFKFPENQSPAPQKSAAI